MKKQSGFFIGVLVFPATKRFSFFADVPGQNRTRLSVDSWQSAVSIFFERCQGKSAGLPKMSSAAARSSFGSGTTPEGCQARLARSLPGGRVFQLNSQGCMRLCSIRTRKAEKGLSDLARPLGKE